MSLLLFILSFLQCALAGASTLLPRDNSTKLLHHRAFHAAIVVGDYLYIDGGEITTWDGQGSGVQTSNPQTSGNIQTLPENYTYSIDLSSSWTNSSVMLNLILKAAPVLNNEALWLDAGGSSFYSYDGGISESILSWLDTPPPANELWQFEPSNDAGHWTQTVIPSSSNFSALSRVTTANMAYGNGLGFALGGIEKYATSNYESFADNAYQDQTVIPGMVIYNTSSMDWYNVSTTGYSYYGYGNNGAAQFVPIFGEAGLLFMFGGYVTTGSTLNSLEVAYMYDPTTQQWQNQQTTGDIPGDSANLCSVGVEGDEGTYEIFVYGGQVNGDVDSTVANGVVHVLSLPAFHWTVQEAPAPFGRFMHTCNVIGNRQMIVVGGTVIMPNVTTSAFTVVGGNADPWEQGIGIFDMTEMQWKSSYNASAASYKTPSAIKSYYAKHGKYPAALEGTVENWFKNPGSKAQSASPGSSGSSGNSTNDDGGNGKHDTNVGAIAGGVVGGVLGLALIGALIYFLLRRQRKDRSQYQDEVAYHMQDTKPLSSGAVEAEGEGHHSELEGGSPMAELSASSKTPLAPTEVHELAGHYGK